eukprot:CAMPEP_0116895022 /NCGR_PEP_ID=MMETSP0467-20121206/4637_1 /TAXON_ID=283647 /ORGANISM="Mesodinium pulex, Strain SPMC105" /LENGTH=113 /DNA_ID=CAMNT_0004565519 /DNA_START=129 /DNA_END=470 /DNA_ORIENTATION=+
MRLTDTQGACLVLLKQEVVLDCITEALAGVDFVLWTLHEVLNRVHYQDVAILLVEGRKLLIVAVVGADLEDKGHLQVELHLVALKVVQHVGRVPFVDHAHGGLAECRVLTPTE